MTTSRELLATVLHRLGGAQPAPSPDLITTGYPSLDRLLAGGIRRGELTAVLGDVGAGKTAVALGIAMRAAVAGSQVLILTNESSEERGWERLATAESGVSQMGIRTGLLPAGGVDAFKSAVEVLRRLPISVERAPQSTTLLVERLDEGQTAQLVIIDGLAAFDHPPRAVAEAHAEVVRAVKRAAVDQDVAVVLTVPMTADRSLALPPRPTLSDAPPTVAVVADTVLGLYREALYDDAPDVAGALEVHVLKHRAAPAGFADLYIEPAAGRVEDLIES